MVEKIPLFALSAISAAITPYAQNHGGSMASAAELSLAFRIENSLQSYMTYITRMFWPGKMSVLYLLDVDHVDHCLYGHRGRGTPADHRPGDLGGVLSGGVTWRWAGSGTSAPWCR